MVISRMLCTMLCAILILTTIPATADDPVPSVVLLPICGSVAAEARGECRCPAGTVTCLDRAESEGVVLLRRDRDRCVDVLGQCQMNMMLESELPTGWDPWTVVGVTVGIVLVVGALAFGSGYLYARAESAGKIKW